MLCEVSRVLVKGILVLDIAGSSIQYLADRPLRVEIGVMSE